MQAKLGEAAIIIIQRLDFIAARGGEIALHLQNRVGRALAALQLLLLGVQGLGSIFPGRAGGRYLYICEFGLVHYCSQQRGYPGVPIAEYGRVDVKREFLTEKSCAPNCTISCVHQVSYIDHWRAPQTSSVTPGASGHGAGAAELVQIR